MDLILLANGFPYGSWEPFLETEAGYYGDFDAVHICAMQVRREHRKTARPLPSDKFHVLCVPFAPMPVYFFEALGALFDRTFREELRRLIKERRFTLMRLAWLLFYVGRSHHEARIILKYLEKEGLASPDRRLLLYSYRFDYQPYTALLLKKHLPDCRLVARAHGYDLYEQVRSTSYIPMRPYLLAHIDRVFPVSDHGLRYLSAAYPAYGRKLSVSRLGTLDHGLGPVPEDGGPLRLASCSTLLPVKRVRLIIEALALITGREIVWTHYGDGPLMDELKKMCVPLPPNIRCEFRGHIDNAAVLEDYASLPYHLFLNVSSSEGVPVSIMEAMSFGIPCLATDVGGTSEILRDGENGRLLGADIAPAELAGEILAFADMDGGAYRRYRAGARRLWQELCDADKNYKAFVRELIGLAEVDT